MRKLPVILILFSIIFIQACNDDNDCVECITPPEPFRFEIIDQATGENLLNNGTYDPGEIEIVNIADDSNVEYTFIDENDTNVLQVHTIGWETETVNYSIRIEEEEIFTLYVDAEKLTEDCCTFTRYNEIRIENTEFELDQSTGIYRILVE